MSDNETGDPSLMRVEEWLGQHWPAARFECLGHNDRMAYVWAVRLPGAKEAFRFAVTEQVLGYMPELERRLDEAEEWVDRLPGLAPGGVTLTGEYGIVELKD